MNLNNIDQKILELLVERGNYISGQDLSTFFGVSSKTIYRRIKNLRESLGKEIIESDRTKGYRVNFKEYASILDDHYNVDSQELSVDGRRLSILFRMLANSPECVSIAKLSEQFFVSQSSIVNDLEIIESKLARSHLKLCKTGLGTALIGEERYIRKELMHIINKQLTNMEAPVLTALTSNNESIEDLNNHFDQNTVKQVKSIIDKANKLLDYTIENPYYINLLTHLLILISRNKTHNNAIYINLDGTLVDKKKYDVANFITNEMKKIFGICLDEIETNYVYAFLISSREDNSQNFNGVEIKTNSLVKTFVYQLIKHVEKNTNIIFSNDEVLRKSLEKHVQPMINRIRYEVVIVNPLTKDIQAEFKELYASVKDSILNLKDLYKLSNISDDEIGYLTLYFQNSIEKSLMQYNILIVCSTGIGSSHFLKTRVNNNFPNFNVVNVISTQELLEDKHRNVDFILTTVNLPETETPHLLIGALLDQGDINLINQFLKNYNGG